MFMFTQKGKVKWWSQGGKTGMILAETRDMAQRFAEWSKKKISIADVVAGLARHLWPRGPKCF